ncbi:hypothetical protein PR048_000462 [Dryococelus australis]|uniref:Uncharacterized protein n=1 Tax=Dryococelus australis TaxID=614101 RepID=A0ABQ9IEP3_9NEOP|nr:hypothetical protein PR048_000462 [Dryococelus australis]
MGTYLKNMINFLKVESNYSNVHTEAILEMFQSKNIAEQLTLQVTFVTEVYSEIIKLITELEGSIYLYAHKLWDELLRLHSCLQCYADGVFPQRTQEALNDCGNLTQREMTKNQLKCCMHKCLVKLSNHMAVGLPYGSAGQKSHIDVVTMQVI